MGASPRSQAKSSGRAVGAVNALVLNESGDVLLQQRPPGKENGGRWDKSVGGHVSAGEAFDQTLLREAGEELFDDGESGRVRLAASEEEYSRLLATADLSREVVLRRVGFQKNLRDVRHGPAGAVRNVLYHVAIYAGRTGIQEAGFRPQRSEIAALRFFRPSEVDALLLRGQLAPNMAFLWLAHAYALVGFAPEAPRNTRRRER